MYRPVGGVVNRVHFQHDAEAAGGTKPYQYYHFNIGASKHESQAIQRPYDGFVL